MRINTLISTVSMNKTNRRRGLRMRTHSDASVPISAQSTHTLEIGGKRLYFWASTSRCGLSCGCVLVWLDGCPFAAVHALVTFSTPSSQSGIEAAESKPINILPFNHSPCRRWTPSAPCWIRASRLKRKWQLQRKGSCLMSCLVRDESFVF